MSHININPYILGRDEFMYEHAGASSYAHDLITPQNGSGRCFVDFTMQKPLPGGIQHDSAPLCVSSSSNNGNFYIGDSDSSDDINRSIVARSRPEDFSVMLVTNSVGVSDCARGPEGQPHWIVNSWSGPFDEISNHATSRYAYYNSQLDEMNPAADQSSLEDRDISDYPSMTVTMEKSSAMALRAPPMVRLSTETLIQKENEMVNHGLFRKPVLPIERYESRAGSFPRQLDPLISSPERSLLRMTQSRHIRSGDCVTSPTWVEKDLDDPPVIEEWKRWGRWPHNEAERRRRNDIDRYIWHMSKLMPQHRFRNVNPGHQSKTKDLFTSSVPVACSTPSHARLPRAAKRQAARTLKTPSTRGPGLHGEEFSLTKRGILNVAVSWIQNMLGNFYLKYQREDELAEYIDRIGGTWPIQVTPDEKRMRAEVMDAVKNVNLGPFRESR